MKRNLAAPTVHLNGTSGADLDEQLATVVTALDAALRAFRHAAPHGRDYYVQGPDAYQTARTEHETRVQRIVDTRAEVYALRVNVRSQMADRQR